MGLFTGASILSLVEVVFWVYKVGNIQSKDKGKMFINAFNFVQAVCKILGKEANSPLGRNRFK